MGSGSSFNKKGVSLGYFEIILVVAVLFIVAVAWLVINSIGSDINNYLLDDPDFLVTNESREVLNDQEARRGSFFDGAFALFFLGIFLLGGISAWYASSNPMFFIVTFLFIIMVLIIPIFLGDTWEEIKSEFGNNSDLRFMNWVMNNYLIFSIVLCFTIISIMFYRSKIDVNF